MSKLTIGIFGYRRSGKDVAAKYFKERFGMQYENSTMAAADIFVYDKLKEKYGYTTVLECYKDRVNHRQDWYELIQWYNRDDKAKLGKEIVARNGCYIGMRDIEEVNACKDIGLFDAIVWIDAEDRVGIEDSTSCTVNKECADFIITNNSTEDLFIKKLERVGKVIFNNYV